MKTQQLIRSRLALLGLATATALVAASCAVTYTDAHYGPEEVNRQVVDATTGEGIADAIVVFEWDRSEADIGHGSRVFCYRVEMSRTDSHGRYAIPSWEGRLPMIMSIFKRSFVLANDPIARAKGIDKLKPGSQDFLQRRAELSSAKVRCTDEEDRKLLALYEEIYEDAKGAAKTPSERRIAELYFLEPVEAAQYGAKEAIRRAHDRERQQ